MASAPRRTFSACFKVCRSCSGLFSPCPALAPARDREFTWSSWFSNFSTTTAHKKDPTLRVSSREVLLTKLGVAMDDQKTEAAWKAFSSFRKSYGFPEMSVTSRLITHLTYSSDPHWLHIACDLVFLYMRKKSGLFRIDVLAKLALSLARAQLPIPASRILRLLLEKNSLPPLDVLSSIILHMVKMENGACLASNFLIQVCSDLSNKSKPSTLIFNLVLDACVRFGSSQKGHELMELMASAGVVADANSVIVLSRIHEMNGLRDEVAKYKDFIDRVSVPLLLRHYRQFYDCLLSLHFKFGDVDSAAKLAEDIYKDRGSLLMVEESKCHVVPIGSHNLKSGLKLLVEPGKVDEAYSTEVGNEEKYIVFRDGKLGISKLALAKLIYGFRKTQKVDELSRFLFSIRNHISLLDVVDACIHIGWLETAHDILDDFELAGSSVNPLAYTSLLEAYNCKGMIREAKGIEKQMKKKGLISMPDEMIISEKEKARRSTKSELAELLVREMRGEEKEVPPSVYEVNSSIYFFCKAKMMEDAQRAYQRIREMNLRPNEQTFASMLSGYSSLKMYRQVTILWGDIKRSTAEGSLVISRDLCESLLLNFIRGGYFERVMEVIAFMEGEGMFVDKGICRLEFLKVHKNLYRRLKASEAVTEAQVKRIECVKEFRKWMFAD